MNGLLRVLFGICFTVLVLILNNVYACHPDPPSLSFRLIVAPEKEGSSKEVFYVFVASSHCSGIGCAVVKLFVDGEFKDCWYYCYGVEGISCYVDEDGMRTFCRICSNEGSYPCKPMGSYDPPSPWSYDSESIAIMTYQGELEAKPPYPGFVIDPEKYGIGKYELYLFAQNGYNCAQDANNLDLSQYAPFPPVVSISPADDPSTPSCYHLVKIEFAAPKGLSAIKYKVTTGFCSKDDTDYDIVSFSNNLYSGYVILPITRCPEGADSCTVKVCAYGVDTRNKGGPLAVSSFTVSIKKEYQVSDFVYFDNNQNTVRKFEIPKRSYTYNFIFDWDSIKLPVKLYYANGTLVESKILPLYTIALSTSDNYAQEFYLPYDRYYNMYKVPSNTNPKFTHSVPEVSRDVNIKLSIVAYDVCKIDDNNIFRSTVGNNIRFDNYPGDTVLLNITPKEGVEPGWIITIRTGLYKDWGYMDKVDVTLRIYDEHGGLLYSKTKTVTLQEDKTVGVEWKWTIPQKDTLGNPIWGQKLTVRISYTAEYTPEAINQGSTTYTYILTDYIEVKPFLIKFNPVKGEIPLIVPKVVKPGQTITVYVEVEKLFENIETVRFCARFVHGGSIKCSHCYYVKMDTKKKVLSFWCRVDPNEVPGRIYWIYVEWKDPFGVWHQSRWGTAAIETTQNIVYLKYYLLYSPYVFPEKLSMLEKLLQVQYNPSVMKDHLRVLSSTAMIEDNFVVRKEYFLLHGLPVS